MTVGEMVVGGLAVASLVLVVVVIATDDSALPVADAAAALDVVVEEAAPPDDDRVDIDSCPFGTVDAAVDRLVPEARATLVERFQWAFPALGPEPAGVTCGVEDQPEDPDDELVVMVLVSGAPGDDPVEAVVRQGPGEVRIEGRSRFHGGEVVRSCARPLPEDREICGATWIHDEADLALTLVTTAPGLGTEEVAAALEDLLPGAVRDLAGAG